VRLLDRLHLVEWEPNLYANVRSTQHDDGLIIIEIKIERRQRHSAGVEMIAHSHVILYRLCLLRLTSGAGTRYADSLQWIHEITDIKIVHG